MEPSTLIGTVGVSFLLIAFLLNLFGFISRKGLPFIIFNILGAAIACVASVMIMFIPFIILELIWVMVGIAGLFKYYRDRKPGRVNEVPFTLEY